MGPTPANGSAAIHPQVKAELAIVDDFDVLAAAAAAAAAQSQSAEQAAHVCAWATKRSIDDDRFSTKRALGEEERNKAPEEEGCT